MVKTPVLFETYIRVDTARIVWDSIKKAQPQKIYFYSNKALDDRPEDVKKNDEIRSWVKEIDWPCELHTFFRDRQVDQYTSLLSSKRWLFENEECGIILEDDSVPSLGFFEYCDFFLDYYKNDKNISTISGDNYISNFSFPENEDHFCVNAGYLFGWATWKDRFDKVNFDLIPTNLKYLDYYKEIRSVPMSLYWFVYMRSINTFISQTKCWDYVWFINSIKNHQKYIIPCRNLVKNIGLYGEHASGGNSPVFDTNVDSKSHYPFQANRTKFYFNKELEKSLFSSLNPTGLKLIKYLIINLLKS